MITINAFRPNTNAQYPQVIGSVEYTVTYTIDGQKIDEKHRDTKIMRSREGRLFLSTPSREFVTKSGQKGYSSYTIIEDHQQNEFFSSKVFQALEEWKRQQSFQSNAPQSYNNAPPVQCSDPSEALYHPQAKIQSKPSYERFGGYPQQSTDPNNYPSSYVSHTVPNNLPF